MEGMGIRIQTGCRDHDKIFDQSSEQGRATDARNRRKEKMKTPSESPKTRDTDGLHKRRGVWHYALTIDGERRFFSTKTRAYQEARKIRAEAIKAQLENKLPTDAAKLRFEILLAKVIEDRTPSLSENTVRIERERSGPLLKYFKGRRVSEITGATIRAYQIFRMKQVGNRTVNLEAKLLRHVLQAAKIWGIVADEYKPLKEDRRGPGRAITESEEKILFDTAKTRPGWDSAFYAALLAANSTMRSIEIKSLRLSDVNLIEREIAIGRTKGNTGGLRKIPLNDAALWACARLTERAAALGAIAPNHFLMPAFRYRQKTDRGIGYDPTRHQKSWRTAWRALVKEAGRRAGRLAAKEAVESGRGFRAGLAAWRQAATQFAGLRFHDLRHLAITKLAESDASDATIQAISGHLSRQMIEHYSHVRAAAKRKAVDQIRSYIPGENPVSTTKQVQ
jgi:integrase